MSKLGIPFNKLSVTAYVWFGVVITGVLCTKQKWNNSFVQITRIRETQKKMFFVSHKK